MDHGPAFVSNVISTILHKLELKAGLQGTGLENDYIQELEGGVETAADDKAEDEEADEVSHASTSPTHRQCTRTAMRSPASQA